MQSDELPVRIALNRRKGPPSFALVDPGDAPLVEGLKWHVNPDGYATRTVDTKTGRKELMARRIMGLTPGDGMEVDHISRDKLDNRRCNLRVVTHAQNSQNRQSQRSYAGLSVHRGVSLRRDRQSRPWVAYGRLRGKQVHIGFFDQEGEAAEAAKAWRRANMSHAID